MSLTRTRPSRCSIFSIFGVAREVGALGEWWSRLVEPAWAHSWYAMRTVRRNLPTGTVTFLFTDVEGSTRLVRELGATAYAEALASHLEALRRPFTAHGGIEVDAHGDASFSVFPTAAGAVEAARQALAALAAGPMRVRIGMHTGVGHVAQGRYVGEDVHKAARIAAAGHGGQALLSRETRELVAADVLDLGEHRLKDLTEPVWIYQLGSDHFPPLTSISNTNLPRPLSSFIGRQREVQGMLAMVRDGARLVTVTGPGGSGKTRLAIQVAGELLRDFRNGVFWVGLAPVRDAALVIEAIAQTLGAPGDLAQHIGQREVLLLLDNFEQVVGAGPEIASLAERCPNLHLLVTSRERLRVRGEVEYPALPLFEPEAIQLFCTRAGLEPDQTVAQLCQRLDRLPLALELAAARASVLTAAQILERLPQRLDLLRGGRGVNARHATLRGTIGWSYELLHEEERRLFARLAVFSGGCTLEAAEEVTDASLDTVQSLVDKSLLSPLRDRITMLETIHEYALERLEISGEARVLERRHADFVLALLEEAAPHLRAESREWLDRMELEHDNLRAALERLEAADESQVVLRLAAKAWWFWSLRGHLAEGRRRVESALADAERPSAARADALMGAADLALDTGDHLAAKRRAEQALKLQRELGDVWGTAYSSMLLGLAFAATYDWSKAQRLFEDSLQLFRELEDEHQARQATRRLAWSHEKLGELESARALIEDNLNQARAAGDEFIEAKSLGSLAQYALDENCVDDAIPMLERAHRIHRNRRDQPDQYWDAILVCRFARALALTGQPSAAVQLLSCFERLFEHIGAHPEAWMAEMNQVTIDALGDRLDVAATAKAQQRGRALTADAAVALALESLGRARGRSV